MHYNSAVRIGLEGVLPAHSAMAPGVADHVWTLEKIAPLRD